MTLHLTKEQFEILTQAQDLLSHIQNGKLEAVIESLCRKEVQKRTSPKKQKEPKLDFTHSSNELSLNLVRSSCGANMDQESKLRSEFDFKSGLNSTDLNSSQEKTTSNRSAVPAEIRRQIFKRDQSCQKCGSKFQLQIDHIKPVWAGSENKESNLQLLCAVHNRLKYQKESGIRPG